MCFMARVVSFPGQGDGLFLTFDSTREPEIRTRQSEKVAVMRMAAK